MATVEIEVEDFRDATLPFVAVEGGPADRWYRYDARYKPSWPVVFVLLGPVGWLVMLMAAVGLERTVTGYLPSSVAAQDRFARRRSRATFAAVASFAGAVGLLWVTSVTGAWQVTVPALVLCVGALGWFAGTAVVVPGAPGLRLDRSGATVELRDVDPAFVDAYRGYRARLVAQRRALADEAAPASSPSGL